jgi:hypothetical protein
MQERPQAWSRPISARSCPASTMDATIGQVSDNACPVASGRTPSTPPGTPPEPKRRGQGTDERHGRHSDITDRHDHEDSLPGRRAPSSGAGVAAWQPRSARRWQHCQRNRDHLSYKAAAWCRSVTQAAPRRIALLRMVRVESRAVGQLSSVMALPEERPALALNGVALYVVRVTVGASHRRLVGRCRGVLYPGLSVKLARTSS